MYGITTGFGDSLGRQISAAKTAQLQRNLVTYHLNGVDPPAGSDVVRATRLIRANCLVRGPSALIRNGQLREATDVALSTPSASDSPRHPMSGRGPEARAILSCRYPPRR